MSGLVMAELKQNNHSRSVAHVGVMKNVLFICLYGIHDMLLFCGPTEMNNTANISHDF